MKIKANRLEIFIDDGYREFTEKEVTTALEKQIPKQPKGVKYDIGGNDYFCLCGEKVKSGFQYCPDCGQALDWSDTE